MTPNHEKQCRAAYDGACDALAVLVRWCRDPIVAELMVGNEGFAAAVRTAEACLDAAERDTGWYRPEFED